MFILKAIEVVIGRSASLKGNQPTAYTMLLKGRQVVHLPREGDTLGQSPRVNKAACNSMCESIRVGSGGVRKHKDLLSGKRKRLRLAAI